MASTGIVTTSEVSHAEPRRPLLAFVPPPLWFAAAFAAGLALQRVVGEREATPSAARARDRAGAALIACGCALLLAAFARFLVARTPILPQSPPRALVVGGAYRLTRNPMYVGLTLLHLGIAAVAGAPYAALLVVAPLALLQAVIVPFEERRLAARFGAAYDAYRARVRRWL